MEDMDQRIAIIGGGPAGLSAAMYLEQKGYGNYAVLESDNRVGGKCCSPEYRGRRFELGAIMGAPSYYAVSDVEKFCGITHDGPQLSRDYKNLEGEITFPFDPKKNPDKIPELVATKSQVDTLSRLLETKYKGYDVNGHRGVAEGRYDGDAITPEREHIEGENPNLKDLALPFKEFCEMNDVPLVQKVWIGPYTSYGYGYFDDIPAGYVLKYLDFRTAMSFVTGDLWTWKDGTQSIWEHLNAVLKHPARLNSKVEKVERMGGKVVITVNGHQEEFDKVIVTAPLQYLPEYFDATDKEVELFGKIDYDRYDVIAFTTKPEDFPARSCCILENMEPERYGHLMSYYNRWNDDNTQMLITYALRNHKDDPVLPYEQSRAMVLDDLKDMHTPVDTIHLERQWYYFPHISSADYASGWYDSVEAMQGQNNTYYAGEIMSFSDIDETCEYSREIVERFF